MFSLNFQSSRKKSLQGSKLYQSILDIPVAGDKTDVIECIICILAKYQPSLYTMILIPSSANWEASKNFLKLKGLIS